jgi:hypothetical protein
LILIACAVMASNQTIQFSYYQSDFPSSFALDFAHAGC